MEQINQSIKLHILDANSITKRQLNEIVDTLQDRGLSEDEIMAVSPNLVLAAAINLRTSVIIELVQSTHDLLDKSFRSFEEKLDELILLMEDRHE